MAAAIDSGEKLLAKWNELVVFEGCYQKAVASAVAANERRRLLVDRMEAKVPGFHDVILDCEWSDINTKHTPKLHIDNMTIPISSLCHYLRCRSISVPPRP